MSDKKVVEYTVAKVTSSTIWYWFVGIRRRSWDSVSWNISQECNKCRTSFLDHGQTNQSTHFLLARLTFRNEWEQQLFLRLVKSPISTLKRVKIFKILAVDVAKLSSNSHTHTCHSTSTLPRLFHSESITVALVSYFFCCFCIMPWLGFPLLLFYGWLYILAFFSFLDGEWGKR